MKSYVHRSASRCERGAAAVEFALVLPILLTFLFGVIGWGLYFDDSNNARQGLREAARSAVVMNISCVAPESTETTGYGRIRCMARESVGAISGPAYFSTSVVTVGSNAAGWVRGNRLVVCTIIRTTSFGLVPMPSYIKSRTAMSIEAADTAPTGTTSQDVLPADLVGKGAGWSGC